MPEHRTDRERIEALELAVLGGHATTLRTFQEFGGVLVAIRRDLLTLATLLGGVADSADLSAGRIADIEAALTGTIRLVGQVSDMAGGIQRNLCVVAGIDPDATAPPALRVVGGVDGE